MKRELVLVIKNKRRIKINNKFVKKMTVSVLLEGKSKLKKLKISLSNLSFGLYPLVLKYMHMITYY